MKFNEYEVFAMSKDSPSRWVYVDKFRARDEAGAIAQYANDARRLGHPVIAIKAELKK